MYNRKVISEFPGEAGTKIRNFDAIAKKKIKNDYSSKTAKEYRNQVYYSIIFVYFSLYLPPIIHVHFYYKHPIFYPYRFWVIMMQMSMTKTRWNINPWASTGVSLLL